MKILIILALIYYTLKALRYTIAYFSYIPAVRGCIEFGDKFVFFKILGLLFLYNYIN